MTKRFGFVLGSMAVVAFAVWMRLDTPQAGDRSNATRRIAAPASDRTAAGSLEPVEPSADRSEERAPRSTNSPKEQRSDSTLRMEPLSGLRVWVKQSDGSIAGHIPVALEERLTAGSSGRTIGDARSSPSDGLALIDLGELEVDGPSAVLRDALDFSYVVVLDIPTKTPAVFPLDSKPAPGDEITVEIPSTGSLIARVTDHEGQPLKGKGSVYYWWNTPEEAQRAPSGGGERVRDHSRSIENGEARFDGVGVGLVFNLVAHGGGHESARSGWVPGPTGAGDETVVHIRLGPPNAEVRFKVVGPDGAPVASTEFNAAFLYGEIARDKRPPSSSHRRLTSDSGGIVTYETGSYEFTRPRHLVLVHEDPNSDERSVGLLPLPKSVVSSERLDLGTIQLEPFHILAEGVVVDQHGATVAGASLRFQRAWGDTWNERQNLGRAVTTDANGRFTFHGDRLVPRMGVTIAVPGVGRRWDGAESFYDSDLAVGDRSLVLEVIRKEPTAPVEHGKLALDLRGQAGPAFLRLGIYWKRHGSSGGGGSTECPPFNMGEFEMERVEPGKYSYWIKARDGGWIVDRIDDIEVRAHEVTRDPRLTPWDVTDKLRFVHLQLHHPSGAAIKKAQPSIDPDGDVRSFFRRTDDEGNLTFVVPPDVTGVALSFGRGKTTANVVLQEPESGPQVVEIGGLD